MAPSSGPATSTALRMPCSVTYVSTSRVVPAPCVATWARKAAFSSAAARVKAWALVPAVGTPWRRPASRLLVPANPATYAARAAATAACSDVRRLPISMSGRPPAAMTMRDAAEATALSWLSTESTKVSSSSPSPKQLSTVRTGEPGKYVSPSAYAQMSPPSRRPSSQARV